MSRFVVWYNSLAQRERILVAVVGGMLAIGVLYAATVPFSKYVNARATRVERKQQDLAWMRGVAPTVRTLATSQPGGGGESLFVVIDRTARQVGLPSALTTPNGENGVRVRLEAVSFDSLVVWLASLQQQYGVSVESANFDGGAKSGIVNASLVLTRGGQG